MDTLNTQGRLLQQNLMANIGYSSVGGMSDELFLEFASSATTLNEEGLLCLEVGGDYKMSASGDFDAIGKESGLATISGSVVEAATELTDVAKVCIQKLTIEPAKFYGIRFTIKKPDNKVDDKASFTLTLLNDSQNKLEETTLEGPPLTASGKVSGASAILNSHDGGADTKLTVTATILQETENPIKYTIYFINFKLSQSRANDKDNYEFSGFDLDLDQIATATETPATPAPTTAPTTAPTEAPTTEAPTTEAPTTEAPTTDAPTTEAPPTEAPTTEAQTTEAPTTEAPTTEAPTTEAPTTEAPTTEAPTTEAPTTEAPTTEAPTTEAPTTEAPTTAPTTAPTAAPTTAQFHVLYRSLGGSSDPVGCEFTTTNSYAANDEASLVFGLSPKATTDGYSFTASGSFAQLGEEARLATVDDNGEIQAIARVDDVSEVRLHKVAVNANEVYGVSLTLKKPDDPGNLAGFQLKVYNNQNVLQQLTETDGIVLTEGNKVRNDNLSFESTESGKATSGTLTFVLYQATNGKLKVSVDLGDNYIENARANSVDNYEAAGFVLDEIIGNNANGDEVVNVVVPSGNTAAAKTRFLKPRSLQQRGPNDVTELTVRSKETVNPNIYLSLRFPVDTASETVVSNGAGNVAYSIYDGSVLLYVDVKNPITNNTVRSSIFCALLMYVMFSS